MGDFLLDFRRRDERALGKAAEFLKFYPDMRTELFEFAEFGLLVTSVDKPEIWGPYASPDDSMLVTLSGRIALDRMQWDQAAKIDGPGGLACKFICQSYLEGGVASTEVLSGNFVIILFDRTAHKVFIVTDRWGAFPAFRFYGGARRLVYSSHPDALADTIGESRNWDLTSFAEFILTGRLSAPFTYYQKIKALPIASTTVVSPVADGEIREETRTYFRFNYRPQPAEKLEELAEKFAAAFKQAVTRRTLPALGRSAVALSGGLDSRTVVCAAPNRQDLITFSCYDEENPEFRIAKSIACEAGVEFVPLKRSFDHYGEHAALGVKISAGMGCIASNHFLGFRDKLRGLGIDNLLTGCYCDYLFKGLALNRRVNRWTTRERLGPFDFSYYLGHFGPKTDLGVKVRQRLEEIFPSDLRQYDSEPAVLAVEQRRVFPLWYEEDNAERTIPQRVMGWYVPIAENDLMEVILNMSCHMKLNRRLFSRMVEKVCGPNISHIADANTGAPVSASAFREAFNSHACRVGELVKKLKPSNATSGSWLNWSFYARQSRVIRSLWSSPTSDALGVFKLVLGKEGFSSEIEAYQGRRFYLFLQLFTLKMWFDQHP